ncbi:MAG: hypothetical protein KDG89_17475 [Geminicoccaceae bacterium]|nr:hypothetical protein [Geminicoccaceae bacterium]
MVEQTGSATKGGWDDQTVLAQADGPAASGGGGTAAPTAGEVPTGVGVDQTGIGVNGSDATAATDGQPSPGSGSATLASPGSGAPSASPILGATSGASAGGAPPAGDEGDRSDGDAEPRRLIDDGILGGGSGAAAAAAGDGAITIPPDYALPAAGQRLVVEVPPGAEVRLEDAGFDPDRATYAVDGNDLVVTLADGGIVVLADFFAHADGAGGPGTTTLSVLDGPEVGAAALLQQAEAAPQLAQQTVIEPAAGNGPAGPQSDGGGASFRAYDPGDIGAGLAPLGPLGPTSLTYSAEFRQALPFDGDGDGGTGQPVSPPPISPPPPASPPPPISPPPPVSPPVPPAGEAEAPTIRLTNRVEGTITDAPGAPFAPHTTPTLPIRGEGQAVPDDRINGVDQQNLTLDAGREVTVTLESESSRSVDTLLAYKIDDAGRMVDVRTVFAGMNTPGQVHFEEGQSVPGTTASLGVLDAGTKLGFLLVNDGGRDYGGLVNDGRLELRSGDGGGAARITDGNPPVLVHVAADGTETVIDERLYFTADGSTDTPNANALNPDGLGHAVSGWDAAAGALVVGFEDGGEALRHDPYGVGRDNDFNDAVFRVGFGEDQSGGGGQVVDLDVDLGARITDPDSATMTAGFVRLDGGVGADRLDLPEGALAGTDIAAAADGAGRIVFTGTDSIANYEKAMSAVNLILDPANPEPGDRVVHAQVTDDTGLKSNVAATTVAITEVPGDDVGGGGDGTPIVPGDGDGGGTPGHDGGGHGGGGPVAGGDDCGVPLIGTAGADSLVGHTACGDTMVGNAGDDYLRGRSGDDVLEGGAGHDFLSGGPGNDLLVGGAGDDVLHPGEGADTVRLGGGNDRVHGFDPKAGDRLDLSALFDDAGGGGDIGRFFSLERSDGEARLAFNPVGDADGPGGGAGRVVATFVDSPHVTNLAALGLDAHHPAGSDGATS